VIAWCAGRWLPEDQLPARSGWSPFETLGAVAGQCPLWSRHVARLAAAAARLGLVMPDAAPLRGPATDLLLRNGHTEQVLRLQLRVTAAGTLPVLQSRTRSPVRTVLLLPTVVERRADDPPGDLKAEPRRFYDAVRQQAQDGGADDGVVVAGDGAVLETATGNLWACLAGVWCTPPLDGWVLPGVARGLLLERAAAVGVAVAERSLALADLHAASAVAVSNAVHGVRPAAWLGTTAAVAPVADTLGRVWAGVAGR
jgi:branched-subunit amino acid aminotransferase/4-amino-4-deoxychorismate lyase